MPRRGTPRRPRPVPFGDKTWVDVQNRLSRWAHYMYPRVDASIMEEALQDAVVDGMTYWQTLASSSTGDPALNFGGAVYRGKLFLKKRIPRLCRRHGEMPYDSDETFWDRADDSPTPDQIVEEMDLEQRARAVLADMDSDELSEFFTFFGGATNEVAAASLGVHDRTVRRHRAARRTDLRVLAKQHGLG